MKIKFFYEKRILHEISTILYEYEHVNINKNNDNINIEIFENKNKNNNKITLIIDQNFPFNLDYVFINNTPYENYIKLSHNKYIKHPYINLYNTLYNLYNNILKCNLNINNWTACCALKKTIDQIINIIDLKDKIKYYRLVNKIKDKYLIEDIDIFSYL